LSSVFRTFSAIETWAPYGQHKLFDLVNLIQSRRSCRNYLDKPIIADILDDLIKIGTSAPSGANSQMWTFSLLPDRRSVLALSEKVIVFFEKLRRLSESQWTRILLKYVGYTKPAWYHKYFHQTMERRIDLWKHEDKDLIFYGAPAAIIVGSKTAAACPAEDAFLATQNILLAAHSMGLGTCLVGYAIEAINREKKIRQFLHIPDDEKPYSVIAVGYPCEEYQRLARRKPVIKRIIKLNNSPS